MCRRSLRLRGTTRGQPPSSWPQQITAPPASSGTWPKQAPRWPRRSHAPPAPRRALPDLGGKNAQLARAVADMRRGAEAARRKKMAEARHNGFDEQACTLSLALPLQQCHRREAGSVATDFRRDHRSIPCAQYSQHPACLPGCVRAMPEAA